MLLAIAMTLAPINYDRLIESLAAVESGNNYEIRGGGLQWTERTWKEEAPHMVYTLAMHKPTSTILAKNRLHRFAAHFIRDGIEPTAYALALSWRFGYEGAKAKLTLLEANDYATRVNNLYEL